MNDRWINVYNNLNARTRKWFNKASDSEISRIIELGLTAEETIKISVDQLTPSIKGANGEEYVKNILNGRDIKNTFKSGKSGDLIIRTSNGLIMIEVKDYSKNVNKDEVKKFFRDINAHSEIKAALFISLHSNIVGIKERFAYRKESIYGRHIPIIYICSDQPEIINVGLDILVAQLESHISIIRDQTELEKKIYSISEMLESMSQARMQIDEFRDQCQRSLDRIYKTILCGEVQIREHIDSIYSSLDINHEKLENINKPDDIIKHFRKKYNLRGNNEAVDALVRKLHSLHPNRKWSLGTDSASQKNCGFRFMKTKVEFYIKIKNMSNIKKMHESAILKNDILYIPVNSNSYGWIEKYILA